MSTPAQPPTPPQLHSVTLDLPVGEGPNDLYQAFASIFQSVDGFKLTLTPVQSATLSDMQKRFLEEAATMAKAWADKLERYG